MSEAFVARRAAAGQRDDAEELSTGVFMFFEPSNELTKAIMEQNQRLVSDYVARNFPPGYETRERESEFPDQSPLGRVQAELSRPTDTVDSDQLLERGKRLVSERLYHYLSSLAKTPRSLEGGAFSLSEFIPAGMATMLGLSAYGKLPVDSPRAVEILQTLERLVAEFRNWLLQEHGSFVTPWIEMHLNGDESLRLIAVEENSEDPDADLEIATEGPEFEVGKTYWGTVSKVADYGAFVEISPETQGLLHVSEIAAQRVRNVREVIKEGDTFLVKIIKKEGTRIHLSRKAVLSDLETSSDNESSSFAESRYSETKANTE